MGFLCSEDEDYEFLLLPKRKIYEWHFGFEDNGLLALVAHEDFSFPQINLEERLHGFEEIGARTFVLSNSRLKKLQEMYIEIKEAEGDDKKWFESLMATEDHEFVCHNVEYKLGGNLDNKSLWLMYIEYLKTHDKEQLLQTYSKFIRYFLEDVTVFNEYRKAAKKYGPVFVPWKNAGDFETYDEKFFEKEKERQNYKRTLYREEPPLMIRFNPETATTQEFPFFPKLMIYIRENASAEVLHKLYKTCKLFPARFPKTICYGMRGSEKKDPFEIKKQHLRISYKWLHNLTLENLFIANVFSFGHDEDDLALSKFIPKIYRCTAKYIALYRQRLTLDELKFLIGHGNVITMEFGLVENFNGSLFIIDEILAMTPCATDITLSGVRCTSETAKKLSEMEFKNKIERIDFADLKDALLEPNDFAKFVMKSCTPNAYIQISFDFEGKETFVTKFQEVVQTAFKKHWEGNDRICLSVR